MNTIPSNMNWFPISMSIADKLAEMTRRADQWQKCAKLAHGFLDSLPHGWLAHTSGDVGLLNDFYIAYREASNLNTQAPNTSEFNPKSDQ